jgi:hypothetical protein
MSLVIFCSMTQDLRFAKVGIGLNLQSVLGGCKLKVSRMNQAYPECLFIPATMIFQCTNPINRYRSPRKPGIPFCFKIIFACILIMQGQILMAQDDGAGRYIDISKLQTAKPLRLMHHMKHINEILFLTRISQVLKFRKK